MTVMVARSRRNSREARSLGALAQFTHQVLRPPLAVFFTGPYRSTLAFDSDLIFLGGIDPLWPALEDRGVLVTRFYPAPYGIHGTLENLADACICCPVSGSRRC